MGGGQVMRGKMRGVTIEDEYQSIKIMIFCFIC